jgi:hypothetical protein
MGRGIGYQLLQLQHQAIRGAGGGRATARLAGASQHTMPMLLLLFWISRVINHCVRPRHPAERRRLAFACGKTLHSAEPMAATTLLRLTPGRPAAGPGRLIDPSSPGAVCAAVMFASREVARASANSATRAAYLVLALSCRRHAAGEALGRPEAQAGVATRWRSALAHTCGARGA